MAYGYVEAQNRSLVQMLKVAKVEKKQYKMVNSRNFIAYRSTPKVTTGHTPYVLTFCTELKLPELRADKNIA